jgi:3',5'-cyclic AMP phosphodiesterase CpdA
MASPWSRWRRASTSQLLDFTASITYSAARTTCLTPMSACCCSLWTEVPGEAREVVAAHLNDYYAIYQDETHSARITVEQLNGVHRGQRAWLEAELTAARAQAKRVLVMTHHLPSFALIDPKYTGNRQMKLINTAFATALDALITQPVHTWVCGHTHTPTRVTLNGVDVVINPIGYPHEKCKLNPRLVVAIDSDRIDGQTAPPTSEAAAP